MRSRLARAAVLALGAVVLVVLALGVGYVAPNSPMIALAVAGGVLLLGVLAAEPAAVSLAAMPVLAIAHRVSAGGFDLSYSDAALIAATLAALVFAPRPFSPALRNLLWLNALYQFATLFTVVMNPYRANVIEWFHAWTLVSGALLVGWTAGRRGHARLALNLLLAACLAIAGLAIVQGAWQWAHGDLSPLYISWPVGMHKNLVGCILGFAAITAYARPHWLRWSTTQGFAAFAVFSVGLLFTQSRQAILALGVALLYVAFREGRQRRRWTITLFAVVPALVLVATLVRDQIESGDRFNSVFQRATWLGQTVDFWLASPWIGYGLRFWYTGLSVDFQPPNAELEVLASAGIVGLAAFLVLMLGSLRVLSTLPRRYGTVAVAVVLSRLVQAQVDLFWVAVQVSIPFVIAGLALGAWSHDQVAVSPWGEADRSASRSLETVR